MKVSIARAAASDLEDIASYIAVDNPQRAASFVLELLDRCQRLAANPKRYALVIGWERTGLRRCVMGNYLIFYRVATDEIEIARIVNSAMDIGAVLLPDT